ncbi:periplasmic chaperone for outer membrane proteins SurA [Kaistia soli DSM 19436]|uniref:Periplasmic chaperone for outer membrane proteins SurA n=1 Tax=Kaistia soli DSM 19436 TaxID=1122133 RepID=A0A1M4UEY4_9HYPH|nr:SurA N-terminal domain-containing protein [Kaistia soli]SHE55133.1 periplasmic chaperone for outer membrane proteins SurA [Kaistia soli DSM 19436]
MRIETMRGIVGAMMIAAAGIGSVAIGTVGAEAQQAVRASVNDQPITNYDVQQRVKMMTLFRQKTSDKIALDQLIDESLADQVAKRANLTLPTDAQVNERVAGIAKQVKLSIPQFEKALGQQGVQLSTLKKFFRGQMTWAAVLRAKASSLKPDVSEADIQAEMTKEGVSADTATIKEFKLQQIVFVIPKGSPAGMAGRRTAEAESFRKRFPGCDGSLALAKTLKGVVVLDIGRRDSTQVEGDAAQDLMKTPVGGTLKPSVTDRGVEVIAVCDVKEVQSTAGIRANAERTLLQQQTEGLETKFKAELRENAKIVYN